MTGEPRVSVVIATRNRRALLAEAVASVERQRGVSWELIVVDDASTDDTTEYLSTLTWARAFRQSEHGERSAARNRGLAEARGDTVMFLDDDDLLHDGALSILCAALDRHPQAVAAVGAREDWVVAEGFRGRDIHPLREETRIMFDELLFGWCANSGQNLYRTHIVRALGGFARSLSLAEDRDLWLRLARRGPLVLCPQTVMTYRITPDQYRPPDIRARREMVARAAIKALPRRERRAALELRRCTALVDAASDEAARGHLLRATRKLAQAAFLAPRLLFSPLLVPWVARRVAGQAYRHYRRR